MPERPERGPLGKDDPGNRRARGAGLVAASGVVLAILLLTLRPALGGGPPQGGALCLLCGDRGLADALENILLFLPLGVALRLAGLRPVAAVVVGAALSAVIEVAQLSIPGRWSTARDVATNTVGVVAGVLAFRLALAIRERNRRGDTSLTGAPLLLLGVPSGGLLLGAWLLQPAPTAEEWFGQWTPRFAYATPYEGRLTRVTLGGIPVPHATIRQQAALREALSSGRTLTIEGTLGPPPPRRAALFAITDARSRNILFVSVHRDALVLRARRRADAVRLDAPSYVLPGFFGRAKAGAPFHLEVTTTARELCAALDGARTCRPHPPPWRLWAFLRPLDGSTPTALALDAVTIALLLLPGTLAFAAARRRIAGTPGS